MATKRTPKTAKTVAKYHRFLTLDEFIDKAIAHGAPKSAGSDKWAGGSFEEAIAMAKDGYEPDNPTIEEIVSQIETSMASSMATTFDTVYGVEGAAVDIGRYLAGEPECMVESVPIKVMRTGRIIRVAVPVGISAGTDQKSIERRGAAVMALLDILARLQFPVEIYAVIAMHGEGKHGRLDYTVKCVGAGDTIDRARVAYALCHRSMFRRLGFSVMDSEPSEIGVKFGHRGSFYGMPSWEAKLEDLEIGEENAIVLPQLTMSEKWSVDDCVSWVREQVERIQAASV